MGTLKRDIILLLLVTFIVNTVMFGKEYYTNYQQAVSATISKVEASILDVHATNRFAGDEIYYAHKVTYELEDEDYTTTIFDKMKYVVGSEISLTVDRNNPIVQVAPNTADYYVQTFIGMYATSFVIVIALYLILTAIYNKPSLKEL